MRIAVIIPALNEAQSLPAVLKDLSSEFEIVVVDNGSTDATAEVARNHGVTVISEPKQGYGTAVLAGMSYLAPNPPDVVCILDADHADDPTRLTALTAPILEGRADLVQSDRTLTADPHALTAVQRFGNALATELIYLTTGKRYQDMGPFRAIRWSSLMKLKMEDPTWGWNVEMQMKAVHHELRILEIPLPYRKRRAGRSKISGSLRGSARAGIRILLAVNTYRK